MTNTKKLTLTALFAAIATIVMFLEFPIPFMPPFLQVDLSGAVILLGVFMLGAKNAVLMLAVKDAIHLLSTKTGGVGELSDFLMLLSMIITLSLVMHFWKGKHKLSIGLFLSVITLVIVGAITNKYLLIPFYAQVMPLDAILNMCQTVNPNIVSINDYILWGVLPFNLIKGILITLVSSILKVRLSKII